jgi:signal transduction histidine kinase
MHVFQQDIILQLRYLVGSFSSMAISRNIRIKFKPGAEHFMMDYDADKLMHIVTNLLSNALKYTRDGDTVDLSAGRFSDKNNSFIIQVQDNGPGIPKEHLPYIFDRFYRIEEDTAQFENGTGLGLALTKELVKLMDGNISVESTAGEGTIFTIKLPVSNIAPLKEMAAFSAVNDKIAILTGLEGEIR